MFKTLTEGCTPTKGTKYSACVDLYASETVTISAGGTDLVGLGVAIDYEKLIAIAEDLWITPFKRSHYLQLILSDELSENGLMANTTVINLDYEDELKMTIHNPIREHHITWWIDRLAKQCGINTSFNRNQEANIIIKKGDKIAQVMLCKHKTFMFDVESDVERDGGVGSTDMKGGDDG